MYIASSHDFRKWGFLRKICNHQESNMMRLDESKVFLKMYYMEKWSTVEKVKSPEEAPQKQAL